MYLDFIMSKFCGFAEHPLEDGVIVMDPIIIEFMHESSPDFRPADEVCRKCRNFMEVTYRSAMQSVGESSASRKGSSSSMDSLDRLVFKTPMHKKLRQKKDSSQSFDTDLQSPIGTYQDSQGSGKSGTNILLESRRQSLNGSHDKSERGSNNNTKTGKLQKNLSQDRNNSSDSKESSLAAGIHRNLTLSPVLIRKVIDKDTVFSPTIYDYDRTDMDSRDTVFSPTIYDYDPTDIDSRDTVFSPTIYDYDPTDTPTSAAAAKAKGRVEK